MKTKSGQITYILIFGLVIILVVGFILYVNKLTNSPIDTEKEISNKIPFKRQSIENFITTCLGEVGSKGINLIAMHGGYLNPSGEDNYGEPGDGKSYHEHYFNGHIELPYIIDGSEENLRDKNTLEEILAKYVIVELDKCADFSEFERQGFKIQKPDIPWQSINFDFSQAIVSYSSTKVSSKVTIGPKDVKIDASYPLLLKLGGDELRLESFSFNVPLRLGTLYSITQELVENIKSNPNFYNLGGDCNEYQTSDGLINVYLAQNDLSLQSYAIRLVDAQPTPAKLPLTFQFALKNVIVSGECTG